MHWIIFNYTLIFIYLFAWQIQRKYGFRWWKCIFSLWQLTNKMAFAKIWIISYTCNSFFLCFIRHFPHWSILEESNYNKSYFLPVWPFTSILTAVRSVSFPLVFANQWLSWLIVRFLLFSVYCNKNNLQKLMGLFFFMLKVYVMNIKSKGTTWIFTSTKTFFFAIKNHELFCCNIKLG